MQSSAVRLFLCFHTEKALAESLFCTFVSWHAKNISKMLLHIFYIVI